MVMYGWEVSIEDATFLTVSAQGPTLDVRIWRVFTSDSDVYWFHTPTSIDVRFWRLKSISALNEYGKTFFMAVDT